MKRILRKTAAATLAFALAFLGIGFGSANEAQAQQRQTRRVNDWQVENIIRSVERLSDTFRRSFDTALDRSFFDGTYNEGIVNEYIKNFETATNDLRSRFDGRTSVAADVDNLLNRAAEIDRFMRTYLRQDRVQRDWRLLRGDLQRLATAYNVAVNWNGRGAVPVSSNQRAYRVNDSQVETLLRRVETKSDTFRTSLDRALDRSRLDNTNREDNITEFVKDFENATDELRRKFDGRTSIDADVSGVLVRAVRIDDFMRRNLRNNRPAQNNWTSLRTDLNLLANYYSLAFNLDNRRDMPAYSIIGGAALTNADASFTGTYRLNAFQSDNARTVAGQATGRLNRTARDRIFNNLVSRLTAPQMIAVQRQGMRVMLASTISLQVTLDADGLLHNEPYPNGRLSNVRASFVGDQLTIVSNGDRANDFTAIFTALDNGRRMMVTRRVYAEGLSQFVEVKSYYDRTAEAAQFNIVNTTRTLR